VNLIILGMV